MKFTSLILSMLGVSMLIGGCVLMLLANIYLVNDVILLGILGRGIGVLEILLGIIVFFVLGVLGIISFGFGMLFYQEKGYI